MSKINIEKSKLSPKINNKNTIKSTQYKSPLKKENISSKLNIISSTDLNIPFSRKNINFIEDNNNLTFNSEINEDKDNKLFKGFLQKLNKIGEFGFNEKNTYTFPISDKDDKSIRR